MLNTWWPKTHLGYGCIPTNIAYFPFWRKKKAELTVSWISQGYASEEYFLLNSFLSISSNISKPNGVLYLWMGETVVWITTVLWPTYLKKLYALKYTHNISWRDRRLGKQFYKFLVCINSSMKQYQLYWNSHFIHMWHWSSSRPVWLKQI